MTTLRPLIGLFLLVISAAAFGKTVDYNIDGKPYEGYYVTPGKNAPLVILLHDWDGLTDYEIKRAEMLKQEGYAVFAADLFGKGIRPTKDEDKKQLTAELYQDRIQLRLLIQGAVDSARAQGGNLRNAVMMGYCFGGTAVLEYARSGADLKGFVSFHGGLTTPEGQTHAATRGSVLVFHGSADTSVMLQDLAQIGTELELFHIPHELISYGGAPHAFTVFGSERYRKAADEKSWRRLLAYLKETLKG